MKSEQIRNYAIAIAVLLVGFAYIGYRGQQVIDDRRYNRIQRMCGQQKHNDADYNAYNICMTYWGYGNGGYSNLGN